MSSGTRQRLIDAAIRLFSATWYGTASVAEICRMADVSNGAFYRHFRDKEEIFCAILEFVIKEIEKALQCLNEMAGAHRPEAFVSTIFAFSQDHTVLVRVFREGQYRFFEYERRLKEVYYHAFEQAFRHRPGIAEYLYALGGLRFASIRSAFHQIPVKPQSLTAILRHGLLKPQPMDSGRVFSSSIIPLPIELLPDSKTLLLRAGRQLFGEKGYFETNVHEITSMAGLATGSFYRHFDSKEAFYSEVIRQVGRDVRRFITINLGQNLNRLEREMRGLWLFLLFLSMDRYCYNIVREAEFVLPEEVRSYYESFRKGYLKQDNADFLEDEMTSIEFMLGVAHYLGIEVVFDHSPQNARQVIEELAGLYVGGLEGERVPRAS